MLVPNRSQYAIRALFELAGRDGDGPVKIAEIAAAQAIPHRFLEVILGQLKRGGFVGSQRGNEGGYFFVRSADDLTVGEVIRFMQGPLDPVGCVTGKGARNCPLHGDCVFMPMWQKVEKAIAGVFDNTTFRDLLEEEERRKEEYVPCYNI